MSSGSTGTGTPSHRAEALAVSLAAVAAGKLPCTPRLHESLAELAVALVLDLRQAS